MNKFLKNITYYSLILLGLTATSWIIWARFLRERTVRYIPDGLFTEYRFWILLYICLIYAYTIKNYVKPKTPHAFFTWLSDLLFTPLITLDHFIKYNDYIKPYYYQFMEHFINYIDRLGKKKTRRYFYIFQIIPRCILVMFLILDTFYFNRLELFYKVILIGLLPFFFRYINYCIKDLYDHWVEVLEEKYNFVYIFQKGYEQRILSEEENPAPYHHQRVSIKEYIEIKYYNMLENEFEEKFPYEYVGDVYTKSIITNEYKNKTYQTTNVKLTIKDYINLEELFHELTPKIFELKTTISGINHAKEYYIIKRAKIIIFSLYFACWSFILIVSYYCYPIEFNMFKYLCSNIMLYLCIMDDPFSMLYGYSLNENCITIEKLQTIGKYLMAKLFKS